MWLIFLIVIISAASAALLAAGYCFFRMGMVRNGSINLKKVSGSKKSSDQQISKLRDEIDAASKKLYLRPHEEVYAVSYDGLRLVGDFFLVPNARATVICVHGYRSSGKNDFSLAADYWISRGFNILLPDQRAHGRSEGKYICYGAKERYDLLTWTDMLTARFGEHPIVYDGVSMGATTVMLACGLETPPFVRAAVADCGFVSMREIFKHVIKNNFGLPAFPLVSIAELYSRFFAGVSFSDSTCDALRLTEVPVFFAHGKDDMFVQPEMSLRNYEACGSPKELLLVENAAHGMSFKVAQAEYEKKLDIFLEKYADLPSLGV